MNTKVPPIHLVPIRPLPNGCPVLSSDSRPGVLRAHYDAGMGVSMIMQITGLDYIAVIKKLESAGTDFRSPRESVAVLETALYEDAAW